MSDIKQTLRSLAIGGALGALSLLWPTQFAWAQAGAPPAAPQPVAEQTANNAVEPLTRGPIHEAFAEPLQYDASKPLIVAQKPPDPIDEVPPDVRPEGDNVVWIPGYWGWDDDRRQFIWISGVWRDAPPGEVWVSGYWTPVENGYQWVPGFWTAAENQDLNYLPEPPATPAEGPSSPQPDENAFWVPGNWIFQADQYAWRPGYWAQMNPNWIWEPARYLWTPRGYLFVGGFWDRPVVDRGLLFAPVAFDRPVYAQPGFTYTPDIVYDTALLTTNLFVRPDYAHYYFGDYYGQTYTALGFQPWFSVRVGNVTYDPLFAHYRTYFARRDPDWANRLEQRYTFLNAHPEARPPRSFLDERRIAERGGNRVDAFTSIPQNTAVVAAPLNQVVNRTAAFSRSSRIPGVESLRLARVTPEQRQDFQQRAIGEREFAQHRAVDERSGQTGRNTLSIGPLLSGIGQRPGQHVVQRPNVPETAPREAVPRVNEPITRTPTEVRPGVTTGTTVTRPGEVAVPPINGEGSNPGRERPFTSPNLSGPKPSELNQRLPPAGPGARGQEPRPVGPGPLPADQRRETVVPGRETVTPGGEREVPGREGVARRGETLLPREVAPREVTPRDAAPRETIPRTVAPREVVPNEVAPRAVTPREVAPRTVTPREVAPREVAPREVAPRTVAPREVAPREVAPRETAPARTATPRESAPRETAPRTAAAPREPAPREARPVPAPREERPAQPPKKDSNDPNKK